MHREIYKKDEEDILYIDYNVDYLVVEITIGKISNIDGGVTILEKYSAYNYEQIKEAKERIKKYL